MHLRVRCDSENGFWEAVADAGGGEWRQAQERAFSVGSERLEESARAALALYILLAERADRLLDDREREVVEHALASARTTRTDGRGRTS